MCLLLFCKSSSIMPRASKTPKQRPPRNRHVERVRHADRILRRGILADSPCDNCFVRCLPCVVVMDSPRDPKCSACTRTDSSCSGRSSTSVEWDKLQSEEERTDQRLRAVDCNISILIEEMQSLQRRVDMCRSGLAKELVRHTELRNTRASLKERGRALMLQDSSLLELSSSSSPPELPASLIEAVLGFDGGTVSPSSEHS